MTAKEYLGQAYRLDQRINANLEEVARLREMASSVSSPSWEEKTGGSRPTDPPFVRCLVKIMIRTHNNNIFFKRPYNVLRVFFVHKIYFYIDHINITAL